MVQQPAESSPKADRDDPAPTPSAQATLALDAPDVVAGLRQALGTRADAIRTGGYEFNSVYDISKYVGSQKTYERAREALDALVDEVDSLTRRSFWLEAAPTKEQT